MPDEPVKELRSEVLARVIGDSALATLVARVQTWVNSNQTNPQVQRILTTMRHSVLGVGYLYMGVGQYSGVIMEVANKGPAATLEDFVVSVASGAQDYLHPINFRNSLLFSSLDRLRILENPKLQLVGGIADL